MRRAYIFADVAEKMAAAVKEREARKEYDAISSPREFADDTDETSAGGEPRQAPADPLRPDRAAGTDRADGRGSCARARRGPSPELRLPTKSSGSTATSATSSCSGSAAAEVAEAAVPRDELRREHRRADLRLAPQRRRLAGHDRHHLELPVRRSRAPERLLHPRDGHAPPVLHDRRRAGTPLRHDKPVYILTSNRTFSAAEEFTYNLKNLKRATVVGDTTGGGAHPGGIRRITDHFGIWLPNGRAINPVTKTNWEGVGIEPHIKVEAAKALEAAHLDALKKIRQTATDPRHRDQLDAAITALQKQSGTAAR